MATPTPTPAGTVDFGRSFTYVSEDPEWVKKVLIGGVFALLSAVLVGVPFVLGYFGRTLRNVAEGAPRPLPEWDDLGGLFNEGLRLTLVYLAYALGFAVVLLAIGAAFIGPAMLLGNSRHGEQVLGLLGGLGMLAFYAVAFLGGLALGVYLPAALARAALRASAGAGFQPAATVRFIQANLGNYLLSLVIYLVAGFVAQFAIVLCCVGIFPAVFWSYLVLARALGDTVRLNPGSLEA
jgi:hypothetical protein